MANMPFEHSRALRIMRDNDHFGQWFSARSIDCDERIMDKLVESKWLRSELTVDNVKVYTATTAGA